MWYSGWLGVLKNHKILDVKFELKERIELKCLKLNVILNKNSLK